MLQLTVQPILELSELSNRKASFDSTALHKNAKNGTPQAMHDFRFDRNIWELTRGGCMDAWMHWMVSSLEIGDWFEGQRGVGAGREERDGLKYVLICPLRRLFSREIEFWKCKGGRERVEAEHH